MRGLPPDRRGRAVGRHRRAHPSRAAGPASRRSPGSPADRRDAGPERRRLRPGRLQTSPVRCCDRTGAADPSTGRCGFGYRTAAVQGGPRAATVVLTVTMQLAVGARPAWSATPSSPAPGRRGRRQAPVVGVRRRRARLRRGKGMVLDAADHDTWSAGSFFTNPVVARRGRGAAGRAPRSPRPDGPVKMSAAWLIEHAGSARASPSARTRAALSTKHTLALTSQPRGAHGRGRARPRPGRARRRAPTGSASRSCTSRSSWAAALGPGAQDLLAEQGGDAGHALDQVVVAAARTTAAGSRACRTPRPGTTATSASSRMSAGELGRRRRPRAPDRRGRAGP